MQGHQVQLYEQDLLMNAYSLASSKLFYGGLRHLENREFRLVRDPRKAIREYAIHRTYKIVNVLDVKWITVLALEAKVLIAIH